MNKPLLTRLALGAARAPLAFELDGQPCTGFDGDTVLTAVLAQGEVLRHTEFSASPARRLLRHGRLPGLLDDRRRRHAAARLQHTAAGRHAAADEGRGFPEPVTTVAIVGAGPAGLRAAERLVRAGLRPVLIDEAPRVGGQIYRQPPPALQRPPAALYGFEAGKARALFDGFAALQAQLDHRSDTLVWQIENRTLHLLRPASPTRCPSTP
jgi:NADPH-dependent 2,4-dienoyl-CoA reductase/sulfur reductase-like enzyme